MNSSQMSEKIMTMRTMRKMFQMRAMKMGVVVNPLKLRIGQAGAVRKCRRRIRNIKKMKQTIVIAIMMWFMKTTSQRSTQK
jgi:hypothetical protein